MKKLLEIKYLYFLLPVLLSIFISLNTFWSRPLVPGFDAPFYLTEIRNFSQGFPNPLTYTFLDRYLTLAFPGTLSRFFGIDPVTSYRIAITAVYLVLAIILFFLFRNLVKKSSLASALSSAIIISPFLLNYSLLFANFTAFIIMFLFFAIETGKDFKYKSLILGVIAGLIFYTHNFSTVSFGLILGTHYLLKLAMERNKRKVIKDGAIISSIALIIGSAYIARYFGIGTGPIAPAEPITSGNMGQLIRSEILTYTGKFWSIYFSTFLVLSLIFFRKRLFKNKKIFIISTAIFVPSFIFSFQPVVGLGFLPERFATLACLSTYFFYVAIITTPTIKFKKFVAILATIPLFMNYLSSDSLVLNKGYRNFSDTEMVVYKEIKPLMRSENSIVLIPSNHYYWATYFLDRFRVEAGEHFVSCGNITERGWLNEINFTFAKLMADKDVKEADAHLEYLKDLLPSSTIYIIADTSLPCGNGKILSSLLEAKQIYNQGGWYVYEIN